MQNYGSEKGIGPLRGIGLWAILLWSLWAVWADTHGEGYTKEVHVLIHTIGGQITDLMGLVF